MKQVIFDLCLFQFFVMTKEDGLKEISHTDAEMIINNANMHGKFNELESPEGTPIIAWNIPLNNKIFLFIDKSGRGIRSNPNYDQVMRWDDELDDTDKSLHEFAKECEVGDIWESRTTKLIRIE